MDFEKKYIKYKSKYLDLLNGGSEKVKKQIELEKKAKILKRQNEYKDTFMNPKCLDNIDPKNFKYQSRYALNKYLCSNIKGKYEVECQNIIGLKQTIGSCYYDSILMALLFDNTLRKYWGKYLYLLYGEPLNKLNNERINCTSKDIDQKFLCRKECILKHDEVGHQLKARKKKLKKPILSGYEIIDFIDTTFKNYLEFYNIPGIKEERADKTIHIHHNCFVSYPKKNTNQHWFFKFDKMKFNKNIKLLNLEKMNNIINLEEIDFFCLAMHLQISKDIFLPLLETEINGYKYQLKSIIIGEAGHAVSIVKCNNEWYYYDNERAKLTNSVFKINYEIIENNQKTYLKMIDSYYQVGSNRYLTANINFLKSRGHSKIGCRVYVYCKVDSKIIIDKKMECQKLPPGKCLSTPNFNKEGNWSLNNCILDRFNNCRDRNKN